MHKFARHITALALTVTLAAPLIAAPRDVDEQPFKRLVRMLKKFISTGDVMSPPNP
jgi:hypothetical protein